MCAAVLCVLLAPALAFSEEPIPEVPEILVEGERPPEPVLERDRAASGSVIGREEIERTPQGVPALVGRAEGVRVRELGGLGSFSSVSIRGSTSNQVEVLLDGVPLNRGARSSVNLSLVPAEQLGRIEIYRGVTPLSVGGSAIGGVVDLRTRETLRNQLEVLGAYGSFGFRQAGVFAARAEPGEDYNALVGLLYEGAENDFSYLDDAGTPLNRADDVGRRRDNADFNQGDSLVRLGYKLARGGMLFVQNGTHVREGGLAPAVNTAPNPGNRLEEIFTTTLVRLDLPSLGDGLALESLAYFDFSRTRFGVTALTNDHDYLYGTSHDLAWDVADELRLEGFFAYSYELFDPRSAGAAPIGPSSDRHAVTVGTGAEWEPVFDELLFVAQFRYEHLDDTLRGSNAGTPAAGDQTRGAPTFRAGARYRPVSWTTLSANWNSAVRMPNFFELFGDNGLVRGNPSLREEGSRGFDVGLDFQAEKKRWADAAAAGVRYFRYEVDDLIYFRPTGAQGVLVATNLLDSRRSGVEFRAAWSAPRFVAFEGNFTWLDAVQKPRTDLKVPFSPEWEAFARVTISDEFSGVLTRAGFWLDYEYLGPNFLGPANLSETAERSLFGAGAFADFLDGEVSLILDIRNLTDVREVNGATIQNQFGFPLPGLTAIGSIRWRAI